jgi:protein-S-isoprenylcysteine O-methyltransferase Ste14
VIGYIVDSDRVAWTRFEAPTWLRLLAVGVGAVDTVLVLWMYRALGINVSPVEEAREIATLITTGPYRWIRHPPRLYAPHRSFPSKVARKPLTP